MSDSNTFETMEETPISETKIRKRKQRAVLSCNDCRRRKLKCDRELPCNRCVNGGIAHTCAYGQEAGSIPSDATPTRSAKKHQPSLTKVPQPENGQALLRDRMDESSPPKCSTSDGWTESRVKELEERVVSLEAQLSAARKMSEPQSQLHTDLSNKHDEHYSPVLNGIFKGKNYRTFFYGSTSPMTIVAHFSEIRHFMQKIYINSTLERLQGDIKVLENRFRTNKASRRMLSIPDLRSLLPDRGTVDTLIQKYFDMFEINYRILHVPTFWAAYQDFWDTAQPPNRDLDAIVLAIMACTICISTHESTRYNPNGSTFRSKAIIWIKACEAWLKRQSNKHRSLATVQVRCLRILALSTTCSKTKEYYQEVEAHLAFMRSSGMHIDPSILGRRCSALEGEMRRRLWATSLELELQASIDKGTQSMFSALEYNCAPPRNINDSELTADSKDLPPSLPTSVFTDTSFLHCSMQSAPLRIKLCALTNSLNTSINFQDLLSYEKEVQNRLEEIPKWTEAKSFQAWSLLDLQLRQFVVILATPRALQAQARIKPDDRYCALTCLEASANLIERHINLMESQNFALCCTRSDYYRAALLICYITYHAINATDTLIMRVAKPIFEDSIQKALRLHEERAMRPGRGSKQHWIISTACSLVGIALDPSQEELLKRQAVDRVAKLLYTTLALQDDPSDESLASEIILGEGTSSASARVDAPLDPVFAVPSEPFPSTGLRLDSFDFANTSEWTLDDFWFFNDMPPLPFHS